MKKKFLCLFIFSLFFILTACNAKVKPIKSDNFKSKAEEIGFSIEEKDTYSENKNFEIGYFATMEGGRIEYYLFKNNKSAKEVFENYFNKVDNIYNEENADSAITLTFKNYKRLQIMQNEKIKFYDAILIDNVILYAYGEKNDAIDKIKDLIEALGI